jgi:hypothetical protein
MRYPTAPAPAGREAREATLRARAEELAPEPYLRAAPPPEEPGAPIAGARVLALAGNWLGRHVR